MLSQSEQNEIEGYLAKKWGISSQLPITHPNRSIMAGIGSGLSAEITATSPTQSYPVPVTVTFKKNGSNHAVSNFANDFTSSKVGSTPTETLVGRLRQYKRGSLLWFGQCMEGQKLRWV